jgi:hypothetical protein
LTADIGKVLTIGANGIVLSTVTGVGSSITGVSLGTITASSIQIVVAGGTNFLLPLATSTNAGLLSPSQFTALNNLTTSGLASTQSVIGNGLIATPFKLVNDITAPGNTYYYGTDATGVKGWYSLGASGITITDVSNSYKHYDLTPTNLNTIPNLTSLPIDATEVTVEVNGLQESAITVDAAGVFTINNLALGYDIDVNDVISVVYFAY